MYYHFINSEYPNGCIRESNREKPVFRETYNEVDGFHFMNDLDKWESKLSDPIPCTSPLGENGQRVEEGKDFEFWERYIETAFNPGGSEGLVHGYYERVAVPLKKEEGVEMLGEEDELHDLLLELISEARDYSHKTSAAMDKIIDFFKTYGSVSSLL